MKSVHVGFFLFLVMTFSPLAKATEGCEKFLEVPAVVSRYGEFFLSSLDEKGERQFTRVLAPKSDDFELKLQSYAKSPNGAEVAALFVYKDKDQVPHAQDSIVRIYNSRSGELLREMKTSRGARQIHWLKRQGGLLALGFFEDPRRVGWMMENQPDRVTSGIEFFDAKTLSHLKTLAMARGWMDHSPQGSRFFYEPSYSLLFDPNGFYLAKVYKNHFEILEINSDLKLFKIKTSRFRDHSQTAVSSWAFKLFASSVEQFERYVSIQVALKRQN